MYKKIFILVLIIVSVFSINVNYAQLNDYSIKGGLQGLLLKPDMDFDNSDYSSSYLGRAFLRFNLNNTFDLELGAGYGILGGEDPNSVKWETSIIPIDLRLLISPFNFSSLNPYIYGGVGALKWEIQDKPEIASPNKTEEDGFDFFIPFGLGFEIKITNSLLFDITGGYSFAFSDDLNYHNNLDEPVNGDNDGYWNIGLGLVLTGESGSSDYDMDGLSYDVEKKIGTNPEIADTDKDGLNDGLEFNQYKTDPLKSDSDGDGLTDGDEVKNFMTNPNLADTDKDKIPDGEEINKYDTDPLRADSDYDDISDYDEINKTKTKPTKSDTDNDGLKDGDELNKYKTSPTNKDSDKDGISDGDEVLKYNTNPIKMDTDGGGTNDKVEIDRNSNPLNPEDDIVLDISAPIVLDGVTFATGSAELTPESEKMLLKALNTLNAYPEITVEIRGYTDDVGKASSNLRLSQKRANSVRYWIVNKGISPKRVIAKGYGEKNPIRENKSKEGRRLNRRIEFIKISN